MALTITNFSVELMAFPSDEELTPAEWWWDFGLRNYLIWTPVIVGSYGSCSGPNHQGPFVTTIQRKEDSGSYATIYTSGADNPPGSTYMDQIMTGLPAGYHAAHQLFPPGASGIETVWYAPPCEVRYYYKAKIKCNHCGLVSAYCTEDSILEDGDVPGGSHTITLSKSITDLMANGNNVFHFINLSKEITSEAGYSDTITNTITLSKWIGSFTGGKLAFTYFLGGADGKVYLYSDQYKHDNTAPIVCTYQSKKFDFGDQFPDYADYWKTVYAVHLKYVDRGACPVTVSLSNNGGVTWTTRTKTIGTAEADGVAKRSIYHFIKTGQFFNIKAESASASATFEWIEVEVELEPGSEYFEIGT